MSRHLSLVLLVLSVGCHQSAHGPDSSPRDSGQIHTSDASSRFFSFEQTEPTRTNAPTFQTDVTIPSGSELWKLTLGCKDHGNPCRRALVMLQLTFHRPTMPPIRVALGREAPPSAAHGFSCWEDSAEGAASHPNCTLQISTGWDGPSADPHELYARVVNDAAPLAAHVEIVVIDPLE